MKKILLLAVLLMPGLASADLIYTFDQPQFDNQSLEFDADYPVIEKINVGYTWLNYKSSPLFYEFDVDFSLHNTSLSFVRYEFKLAFIFDDVIFGSTRTVKGGMRHRPLNGSLNRVVFSSYDNAVLREGFEIDVAVMVEDELGGWKIYDGEDTHFLGFDRWHRTEFSLANQNVFVPEPYTAALFAFPLAFLGYRRFKRK